MVRPAAVHVTSATVMKFFPIFLLIALTARAAADLPKKAPVTRYTSLWTNSPFTTKPPPPVAGQEANPLEDYALGGISPVSGGNRVTLLNRKKPDERITIDPNDSSGFKVLAVNRIDGKPMGTTVRLSTAGKEGTVAFDESLLVLKTAAPQPQQPMNPGMPQQPNAANGQPPGVDNAPRQPRPRVVTPPANPGINNPNLPQQRANPNIPQPRPNIPQPQQQQRPTRR
jgi:hypothetical protein